MRHRSEVPQFGSNVVKSRQGTLLEGRPSSQDGGKAKLWGQAGATQACLEVIGRI